MIGWKENHVGMKKFKTRLYVQRWVEAFKCPIILLGLTNNQKLILQILLDSINAETNMVEGVHKKHDSLPMQRFKMRMRQNCFNQDEALESQYEVRNMETLAL